MTTAPAIKKSEYKHPHNLKAFVQLLCAEYAEVMAANDAHIEALKTGGDCAATGHRVTVAQDAFFLRFHSSMLTELVHALKGTLYMLDDTPLRESEHT